MSDRTLEIIETNLKHNTEDIRDLKRRLEIVEGNVENLKIDNTGTKQSLNHVYSTVSRLENSIEALNNKFDLDRESRHQEQITQLKEYKGAVWQIGIYLTCVIAGAFLLLKFGL